jgi:hypothetical protein
MAAVSETIVREFFELLGFLVRQQRKHVTPGNRDAEVIDFFVWNPRPADGGPVPLAPTVEELLRLERAVVVVKGWHTETFSVARLNASPEVFRFVEPAIFRRARREFGAGPQPARLLVVPALPRDQALRRASLDLLRAKGVDIVLPFRAVLAELVRRTKPHRNYQKSDLLQIIRVLKHHDFIKEPQLELFAPRVRRRRAKAKKPAPGGTPESLGPETPAELRIPKSEPPPFRRP